MCVEEHAHIFQVWFPQRIADCHWGAFDLGQSDLGLRVYFRVRPILLGPIQLGPIRLRPTGPFFDLGQKKYHRDLFDLGQNILLSHPPSSVVGKHSSPEGWVGPQRVGGPKGGPKMSLFFPPLPPHFSFFVLSRGGLFVEFWWCLKRQVPEMCTFGVLGLSCEARRRSGGGAGPAPAEHPNLGPTQNNTQTHTQQTHTHTKSTIWANWSESNWPKSNWPESKKPGLALVEHPLSASMLPILQMNLLPSAGGKLFMLLPRMLHRPARGGLISKEKFAHLFDLFARGEWLQLLEMSEQSNEDAARARRRRKRTSI